MQLREGSWMTNYIKLATYNRISEKHTLVVWQNLGSLVKEHYRQLQGFSATGLLQKPNLQSEQGQNDYYVLHMNK